MEKHASGMSSTAEDVSSYSISFPDNLDLAGTNCDLLVQDVNGELVWAEDVASLCSGGVPLPQQLEEEVSCGTVVDMQCLSDCMSTC